MAVAELRRRDEVVRDLSMAWHIATFGIAAYVGKLPDLAQIIRRSAPQTHSRERVGLDAKLIAAQIGVPLKPISDAAKRALLRLQES